MQMKGGKERVDLGLVEKRLGTGFRDRALLLAALTHVSYAEEAKRRGEDGQARDNKRLEFLGDAVMQLVVSDHLMELFPHMPEGEMTLVRAGVVRRAVLARKAAALGLGEFLLLGKGEEATGGRKRESILAGALEAVAGALYLDAGFGPAKRWVRELLSSEITRMADRSGEPSAKNVLQELVARVGAGQLRYDVVAEEGPEHARTFTVHAVVGGEPCGVGTGHSKKEAEQAAAHAALRELRRRFGEENVTRGREQRG